MYLTENPISLQEFFSVLPGPSCGALASLVGIVRDEDEGRRVRKLYYECYASMAEKTLERLIGEAREKWDLKEVRILHRTGCLEPGEIAVVVAVGSAHRDEAFKGCRFLIERIKKDVPIWKRQIFEDGTGEWVLCDHSQEVLV